MLSSDGKTPIPVPIPYINFIFAQGFASEINYGSQVGASFVMLLVLVLMTPKSRFARIPVIVNIPGLAMIIIRTVLLSLFFTSSWLEFYTVVSGDYTYVEQVDSQHQRRGHSLEHLDNYAARDRIGHPGVVHDQAAAHGLQVVRLGPLGASNNMYRRLQIRLRCHAVPLHRL